MTLVPDKVVEVSKQLGYEFVVNCVDFGYFWSAIVYKNGKKFNVQIGKTNNSVMNTWSLDYRYNNSNSKVIGVNRILVK